LQQLWKGLLIGNCGKQPHFYVVEGSMIPEVCLLQFMAIHLEKIVAGTWRVRFHVIAHACCLWKLIIAYLEKCASAVYKMKDTPTGLPAYFQRNHL
jgi:hypothetical protein